MLFRVVLPQTAHVVSSSIGSPKLGLTYKTLIVRNDYEAASVIVKWLSSSDLLTKN